MTVETLLRYEAFAWHYEAITGDRSHDGDLEWYASRLPPGGGPVLELACGTGRVALALAAAGRPVVGLDLSEAMLRIARLKAAARGLDARAGFVAGAMQEFELGRRFDAILIPYASFALLLTRREQADCLACVRRHLAPGGRFLLDMNFFDAAGAVAASSRRSWDGPVFDPERHAWISRRAVSVRMRERDVIEYEFSYRCRYDDGSWTEMPVPFAFNTLSPIDLIGRLESGRLAVVEASAGPDAHPFRLSDRRVFIAAVAG